MTSRWNKVACKNAHIKLLYANLDIVDRETLKRNAKSCHALSIFQSGDLDQKSINEEGMMWGLGFCFK